MSPSSNSMNDSPHQRNRDMKNMDKNNGFYFQIICRTGKHWLSMSILVCCRAILNLGMVSQIDPNSQVGSNLKMRNCSRFYQFIPNTQSPLMRSFIQEEKLFLVSDMFLARCKKQITQQWGQVVPSLPNISILQSTMAVQKSLMYKCTNEFPTKAY